MAVSVKWFDDLDAVGTDAAGALDRACQPVLYDRLDWFKLTQAHVLSDARLAVARLREGDDTAWLFLRDRGGGRAEPFASWYTLRFAPVISANGRRLLPQLMKFVQGRFDRVSLHPMPETEPLCRGFRARISTNWTLDLADSDFAAYWAGRPARLRSTIARRQRSHPVEISIYRIFDPDSWTEYEHVYAESWKPREGSPAFLRALAMQEGAAGTLRLGIARSRDGHPLAAQFWLVENGIATIHKLAHREEAKAGSPGSLLSHAMFRSAIEEDRVRRIDFGLGNERYKADWVDTVTPIWRIDAYQAASIHGAAGIAREMASRLARRLRGR